MKEPMVLVLGGSGFVGRHLVSRLCAQGYRVVVPTRRRERAKQLFLLPTVDVIEANIHDPATLERLMRGATAVINLVGILNETARDDFERVHVGLARKIVAAFRTVGVTRLVHMSALNAEASAPSHYLRTKAAAEESVAAPDLQWTIFQPSIICGRGDSFLTLFARLQRMLPLMALARADARFQPVFVGDVVRAVVHALADDATLGKRYRLCGPSIYTLRELVRYAGELSGNRRPIVPLGPALSKLQARILEMLPGKMMSRDNLASMQKDSVCHCDFPAVFRFAPTPLEAYAPEYLVGATPRSRYASLRSQSGR